MDTKLFGRNQPGGLFSILDRGSFSIGNIYWVCSTTGTDAAGFGGNPGAPFATLVYAETQAGTDDTIFVMPGHTETLASAAAAIVLTLDVIGLKVIGLGNRSRKPAFLIDGHASNYVSITAADTVLQNLVFKAGHADMTTGINVAAAGVEFRGCDFIDNTAGENFTNSILTSATGDRLLVEGCRFVSIDAVTYIAIHMVGACNDVVIRNNYFNGPYITSAIETISFASLDILIEGNVIRNSFAEGDALAGAIDLVTGSTGMIVNNRIYHADNTNILTSIDGGNCGKAGNLGSNEFAKEAGVPGALAT